MLPNVNSFNLNWVANSVISARLHTGRLKVNPSKKTDKWWWQKCSGYIERCTTIGLRISGHRAAGSHLLCRNRLRAILPRSRVYRSKQGMVQSATGSTRTWCTSRVPSWNAVLDCCEHHTSHVVFSHWFTRTCVAQVACLSCAHHVSSSCVWSDSLRLLHFPLFAYHLLSYHPVLPPARQLHLPGCGVQIPCALSLMKTLAPLPSTTLSQVMSETTTTSRRLLNRTSRNPWSRTGPWTRMRRVRWLHHRPGALFTTVHPGARRWCVP